MRATDVGFRDVFDYSGIGMGPRRLRTSRPALRVLYMSGYTRDDIVRRGLAEDVEPFLQKPFTTSALGRAIRRVLD